MTDFTLLEKTLGVTFNDKTLLFEALTHRSYLNENPKVHHSNERLEFLGDSVLSLLTSTELFHLFQDAPEGELTALRSNLVRAKTLSVAAQKLNLGAFLQMSHGEEKSGGRDNPSLLANTFEAVLGAIYLDQGLENAKKFLEFILFPEIPQSPHSEALFDFKSRLQEVVQEQSRVSPTYRILSEIGPDHAKIFSIGVYVSKKQVAVGTGRSKQEAEQEAAKLALEILKK